MKLAISIDIITEDSETEQLSHESHRKFNEWIEDEIFNKFGRSPCMHRTINGKHVRNYIVLVECSDG